ncbi:MAG: class I SAM-dependent methyltransferase [Rhizobiaceae bacterium]
MAIANVLPSGDITTLETGCGKSTIMFSQLAKKHYVFAYDDRDMPDSSVTMVQSDPDFGADSVEFVYGPTQNTLPVHRFPEGTEFDVILIDGPHGYPFPDLEYALLYPLLKIGGILIIDDVHIPSIGHMFDTLREDRMYDEIGVFATTAVLRRTEIEGVPATGDHWYEQQFNYARFPLSMDKYRRDSSAVLGQKLDFTDRATYDKHAVRGLEYSGSETGALTTDMSSTFSIEAPRDGGALALEIEYQSRYQDAAKGAEVMVGTTKRALAYAAKRKTVVVEFPEATEDRVTVTFLHPSAIPEDHRGLRRYDFRRWGSDIFSIKPGLGKARKSNIPLQVSAAKTDVAVSEKPVTGFSEKPIDQMQFRTLLQQKAAEHAYVLYPDMKQTMGVSRKWMVGDDSPLRFLPDKLNWHVLELMCFEGTDFANAATLALRNRMATPHEIHMVQRDPRSWNKLWLLFETSHQNRREKSRTKLVGPLHLYVLWRIAFKLYRKGLTFAAKPALAVFKFFAKRYFKKHQLEIEKFAMAYELLQKID